MWKSLLNFGLGTAAVCVLVMGVFIFGPIFEVRVWPGPVYSKFRIVEIIPVDEGHTRVRFEYTKFRECQPQGFAWYTGELGAAFRQIGVVREDTASKNPAPRPLGRQVSEVYIIDASEAQIRDATFAQIYNDCHPGWLTKSDIYP